MTLKNSWSPRDRGAIGGQNKEAFSEEAAMQIMRAFGIGTFAAGTSAELGKAEWLWQAGTETGTAAGGGKLTITFPNSFPKGLLVVIAWGDALMILSGKSADDFEITRNDAGNVATEVSYLAVGR